MEIEQLKSSLSTDAKAEVNPQPTGESPFEFFLKLFVNQDSFAGIMKELSGLNQNIPLKTAEKNTVNNKKDAATKNELPEKQSTTDNASDVKNKKELPQKDKQVTTEEVQNVSANEHIKTQAPVVDNIENKITIEQSIKSTINTQQLAENEQKIILAKNATLMSAADQAKLDEVAKKITSTANNITNNTTPVKEVDLASFKNVAEHVLTADLNTEATKLQIPTALKPENLIKPTLTKLESLGLAPITEAPTEPMIQAVIANTDTKPIIPLVKEILHSELLQHPQGLEVAAGTSLTTNSEAGKQFSGFNKDNSLQLFNASFLKADKGTGERSQTSLVEQLPRSSQEKIIERIQKALESSINTKEQNTLVLRLDPAELGHVRIRLTQRSDELFARIIPERADVEHLLKTRSNELNQILAQSGLKSENIHVSIGTDANTDHKAGFQNFMENKSDERKAKSRMDKIEMNHIEPIDQSIAQRETQGLPSWIA